ncbi:MAG: hypothetical protein IKR73_08990 [Oscillospiraceae bacterium]|nr:hypothetical protein [Oscillospiraceae bacterium]
MDQYLKYARTVYVYYLETVSPSSDHVIDGTKDIESIVEEAIDIIISRAEETSVHTGSAGVWGQQPPFGMWR